MRHLFLILAAGLFFSACQTPSEPKLSSSDVLSIDSTIIADKEVESYINPLRDSIETIMNEAIGRTNEEFIPEKPGTPLSNFVADLLLDAGKKEISQSGMEKHPAISVINIKGLRAPLPQGIIRVKHIFALMPFENQMVILKHTGNEIKELFQHMGSVDGDGLAGGSFTFNNEQVTNATINGEKIKDEDVYYVITSDYLANGGDHYTIFSQANLKKESSDKVRELIIDHIRKITDEEKIIAPSSEKRIIIK